MNDISPSAVQNQIADSLVVEARFASQEDALRSLARAAVLVDVDTWNETLRRLAVVERIAAGDRASAAIRGSEYDTEDDIDAGFQERGLA